MTVIRLTPDVKMIVAASPDYLARRGVPTAPLDLRRHACINWRLPGRDAVSRWEFEKKGKKVEITVEGPLIANHQDVGVAAALQGLGILYSYDDDGVGQAIEQGRLERILADWSPVRPGLYLYYSNRRHTQPALRAFIDCMLDRDEAASKRRVRT
jgi:DNA-binding transcriptional LysR family regulator